MPFHRQLILNGQNIPKGRYPYYVSLDYHRPTEKVVLSGVLIAPDVVLTAGHCLPQVYEYVTARIGTYSLSNDTHIQEYDVVESIRHPLWAETALGGFTHDFSLFRLNETVPHPVLARINKDDSIPKENTTLQVLGLGWTSLQPTPADVVQMSNLTPVSSTVCSNISDTFRNISYEGMVDDTMICFWAGEDNSHDSCGWDSGGPVIYNSKGGVDGDFDNDLIVGLVSWGVDGCADPVFPSVYARVSAGVEWISKTLCALSTQPPARFKCPKNKTVLATEAPTTTVRVATPAPTVVPIVTQPPLNTKPPVVVTTQPPTPVDVTYKEHLLPWPMQLLVVLTVIIGLLIWHFRLKERRQRQDTDDSEQERLVDYGSIEETIQH